MRAIRKLLGFGLGLTFALGCKHVGQASTVKSLQDVFGLELIPKTIIAVDGTEPVSLMIDNQSKKPTRDSKLSVWTLTLTLEAVDSEEPCAKRIQGVETKGERGRLSFVQTDHGEGESTYIYAYKLDTPPVAFNEFLITFEKDDNGPRQCRILLEGDGHWAATGDIGYSIVSDNPGRDKVIRAFGSTPSHRLSHYMWHTSRGLWDGLIEEIAALKIFLAGPDAHDGARQRLATLEKTVSEYQEIGWAPPRYIRRSDAATGLTGAGEDFFYMHHEMLGALKNELKAKGFAMIPAWDTLPAIDDPKYPLAPPGVDRSTLADAKSDAFYNETQRIWELAYRSPTVDIDALAKVLVESRKIEAADEKSEADRFNDAKEQVKLLLEPVDGYAFKGVKGITLGEYGHLIEMTIHNNLHTRYAFPGTSRPGSADPLDKASWPDWAKSFDVTAYDWLGDTYSSHVHPWFYRIHGWVDARIKTWLEANDFKSIGKKDECPQLEQPCYVWLSDSRYVNKGSDEPWAGPTTKVANKTGVMQLKAAADTHIHDAGNLNFSPDVIQATRGLRAQNSSMNRLLINPKLRKKMMRQGQGQQ